MSLLSFLQLTLFSYNVFINELYSPYSFKLASDYTLLYIMLISKCNSF